MIQDANKLVVFGSQFIGVIIVVVGLLTQQAELRSPRPAGSKSDILAKRDEKGGAVRPSPYPLRVCRRSKSPQRCLKPARPFLSTQRPRCPHPQHRALRLRPDSDGNRVARVSSSGTCSMQGQFREIDELLRPRNRYAVVSAVLTAGYLPVPESVLRPLFDEGARPPEPETITPFGYFEVFRSAVPGQKFGRATVVWTPKEVPITEAKVQLIRTQVPAGKERDSCSSASCTTAAARSAEDSLPSSSSSACLTRANASPSCADNSAEIPGRRGWIELSPASRSIRSDDVLVAALVREPFLRIPALLRRSNPLPRIAVFTESDTTYSRAIASELRTQLQDHASVEEHSYLRGLDGDKASKAAPQPPRQRRRTPLPPSCRAARFPSAASAHLNSTTCAHGLAVAVENTWAARAESWRWAFRGATFMKDARASGRAPGVTIPVFFTTDLDALYLGRDHQRFTRNLVVASADDLDVPGTPTNAGQNLPDSRGKKGPPAHRSTLGHGGPGTQFNGLRDCSWPRGAAAGHEVPVDETNRRCRPVRTRQSVFSTLRSSFSLWVTAISSRRQSLLAKKRCEEAGSPEPRTAMDTWARVVVLTARSALCPGVWHFAPGLPSWCRTFGGIIFWRVARARDQHLA